MGATWNGARLDHERHRHRRIPLEHSRPPNVPAQHRHAAMPVWLAIARSDDPRCAAVVTNPIRNECPLKHPVLSLAASAARFTTRATVSPCVRLGFTFPCRSIARNTGPSVTAAASSHARSARTGHASPAPYGFSFNYELAWGDHDAFRSWTDAHGIAGADLTEGFRGWRDAFLFADPVHFTLDGHAVMASLIDDAVKRLLPDEAAAFDEPSADITAAGQ